MPLPVHQPFLDFRPSMPADMPANSLFMSPEERILPQIEECAQMVHDCGREKDITYLQLRPQQALYLRIALLRAFQDLRVGTGAAAANIEKLWLASKDNIIVVDEDDSEHDVAYLDADGNVLAGLDLPFGW